MLVGVCRLLLAVGGLLIDGCVMFAVCRVLRADDGSLRGVHCSVFAICCVCYCRLTFGFVCCLLFDGCCLLFCRWLLPVGCC